MRRDMFLTALVSCAFSTAATLMATTFFGHGVAAQGTRPDMITLRDQTGTERAMFGVLDSGAVGLFFLDRSGEPRAAFALTGDGSPMLSLNSPGAGPSTELRVSESGGSTMEFKDEQGLLRMRLQSNANPDTANMANGIVFLDSEAHKLSTWDWQRLHTAALGFDRAVGRVVHACIYPLGPMLGKQHDHC